MRQTKMLKNSGVMRKRKFNEVSNQLKTLSLYKVEMNTLMEKEYNFYQHFLKTNLGLKNPEGPLT